MKKLLLFFVVLSGCALAQAAGTGTISQQLGPVTAVAGTGSTALQCVFSNAAGNISIACTIASVAVYTATMSPMVIPPNTTGLLVTIGANGNSITWIVTPTATPNIYNWSITANANIAKGIM